MLRTTLKTNTSGISSTAVLSASGGAPSSSSSSSGGGSGGRVVLIMKQQSWAYNTSSMPLLLRANGGGLAAGTQSGAAGTVFFEALKQYPDIGGFPRSRTTLLVDGNGVDTDAVTTLATQPGDDVCLDELVMSGNAQARVWAGQELQALNLLRLVTSDCTHLKFAVPSIAPIWKLPFVPTHPIVLVTVLICPPSYSFSTAPLW